MKREVGIIAGVFALSFLIAGSGYGQTTARAQLRNGAGEAVGNATFAEEADGVKITVEASGLAPGSHGFHIHAVAKCDPPDFASAGGHFNPLGKKHGVKNPEGAHAGDLPNLEVGSDGTGKVEVVDKAITLGEGPNSLFQADGTSLVIHASADDEVTDPSGNSGARIVCGVISK